MLRCTHPSYRRRNLFEAAIYTKPGASGTHEPPSGGPHIGGAPATPIAALSGSTHKAPGSAGGYLHAHGVVGTRDATGETHAPGPPHAPGGPGAEHVVSPTTSPPRA